MLHQQNIVATPDMLKGALANAVANVVAATDSFADAKRKIEAGMQLLEKLALGVEMINHPLNTNAMVRQNKRIWSRL